MATDELKFTANGEQFDLFLTFAGNAISGQIQSITGTVGSEAITGLNSNYEGPDNTVSTSYDYLDYNGVSFETANTTYNVFNDSVELSVISSGVDTLTNARSSNIVLTAAGLTIASGGYSTTAVEYALDRDNAVGTAGAALTGDTNSQNGTLSITAVTYSTTTDVINPGGGATISGTYGDLTLNSDGSYSYTANNHSAIDTAATGSHPVDDFSFTVSNGSATLDENFEITLDRAPTVIAQTASAVESATVMATAGTGVLAGDSDPDGDTLSLSSFRNASGTSGTFGTVLSGSYGDLTLNSDGSYSYYANNSQALSSAATGSKPVDTFTIAVSDGEGGTTQETLSFTVDRMPTIPNPSMENTQYVNVVETQIATATGGTSGTGMLAGVSDPDGDTVSVSGYSGNGGYQFAGIALAGRYGSLTVESDGSYTYTANNTAAIDSAPAGRHPTDMYTVDASDGQIYSPEYIFFTIDRAPVVTTEAVNVVESHTVTATGGTTGTGALAGDSDADNDSLTITGITGGTLGSAVSGTYGELTLNSDGSYSYAADNTTAIDSAPTGTHLTDSFTVTVDDGQGGTTPETLNFTLDRAPTVTGQTASVVETATVSGTSGTTGTGALAGDSDADNDSLTITGITGGTLGGAVSGTYGELTLNSDGSYSYAADNTTAIDSAPTGAHLTDSFTVTVDDGNGGSNDETLTFTLDRAPTVIAQTANVVEGGTVTGTGSGGGVIAFAIQAGNGGTGALAGDIDPDGDGLTVTKVGGVAFSGSTPFTGAYGDLTLDNDGSYSYSADNTAAIDSAATGAHLTDSFTLTVDDGNGGSTDETLTFTLDRAPAVIGHKAEVVEGGTVIRTSGSGALSGDSDADGDSLTVTKINGTAIAGAVAGTYGHLTLSANGSYTYVADNTAAIDAAATGSHLTDSFTLLVDDGHGGTTDETLKFVIDRPDIATADSVTVTENGAVVNHSKANLLANDVNPDTFSNKGIVITAVNGSSANVGNQITDKDGALITVNANGTYTYDPNGAFAHLPGAGSGASNTTATDSFTYTITGGSTVTVTVTIDGLDSKDYLLGTTGADTLNGGIGNDIIFDDNGHANSTTLAIRGIVPMGVDGSAATSGGTDVINGGVGNDVVLMGANLIAADQIDGGSGFDRVDLNGNYTGLSALVMTATTIVGVESLVLTAGHSYDLTTADATVAAHDTLIVNGARLSSHDSLTFDGSAETDGNFRIYGGHGHDTITGGAGNDVFKFGAGFLSTDILNGGGGDDALWLNGDYTGTHKFTFGAQTLDGIGGIKLDAGHSYDLTTADATVAAHDTLIVNGAMLSSHDSLTFDGSAETDGQFVIYGGAGHNIIKGGAGNDEIHGGSLSDNITGGGGADRVFAGTGSEVFSYNHVTDSTGMAYDKIINFDALSDRLDFGRAITVDTAVTTGQLGASASFDAQLTQDVDASDLAAHHAVLFTASSGRLTGHTFLIVDANGVAGYQAGQDYVIELVNGTHMSGFGSGNFA